MEQVLDPKTVHSPSERVFWKRVRLCILLFILAALIITHLILRWSDNEARFYKIRSGMNAKQVISILGEPSESMPDRSIWKFDEGTVYVDWDQNRTVFVATWAPTPPKTNQETPNFRFLRNLLRRIGL
jgi:hypothetical protein